MKLFLFYAVLVIVADQIVLGLLSIGTKISNKFFQNPLLNGNIYLDISYQTTFGVGIDFLNFFVFVILFLFLAYSIIKFAF